MKAWAQALLYRTLAQEALLVLTGQKTDVNKNG